MPKQNTNQQNTTHLAVRMADLTFNLLENCQEKQEFIAEKLNLSVSEFRCLRSFHNDSVLSVKETAARMNLTSSRLTRIIDGLVEKGFVTRNLNVDDRRVMDVALTAEGESVSKRLNKDYTELHEEILGNISPESRDAVIQALDKLSLAMNKWMDSDR